jgi:hypothetical protein
MGGNIDLLFTGQKPEATPEERREIEISVQTQKIGRLIKRSWEINDMIWDKILYGTRSKKTNT